MVSQTCQYLNKVETKQLNGTPVTLISLQFQFDQRQEITYCVAILPSTQFSHRPITRYATHALGKSQLYILPNKAVDHPQATFHTWYHPPPPRVMICHWASGSQCFKGSLVSSSSSVRWSTTHPKIQHYTTDDSDPRGTSLL